MPKKKEQFPESYWELIYYDQFYIITNSAISNLNSTFFSSFCLSLRLWYSSLRSFIASSLSFSTFSSTFWSFSSRLDSCYWQKYAYYRMDKTKTVYLESEQQCIVKVVRKTLKLYGKGGILWLQISAV